MFERGSLTLLRVGGIPIRAHWSLLVILPYVAFVFSRQYDRIASFAGISPASVTLPPLAWGTIVAFGLFVSIAIHELAHSLVAMRYGGRVRDITLMLFGGVSRLEGVPRRPAVEALVSAVGPGTSLAIGGGLLLLERLVPGADLRLACFYLAYLNLVLGLFNLLPAFPMDGGRVLRAALAAGLGAHRATGIAAAIGSAAAVLLAVWGMSARNWLLIVVALFIFMSAQAEARIERMRDVLSGLRVSDLLMAPAATIPAATPLGAVLGTMHRRGRLESVVVDAEGSALGVVRAVDIGEAVARLPADEVIGAVLPRFSARSQVVPWHAGAETALDEVGSGRADFLIVVVPEANGRAAPVGIIGIRELESAVALRSFERRRSGGPAPVR